MKEDFIKLLWAARILFKIVLHIFKYSTEHHFKKGEILQAIY